MVLVRETVDDDWQALRDIRLEALRDAPESFGSSYEREILRPEARLARLDRPGRDVPRLHPRVQRARRAGRRLP